MISNKQLVQHCKSIIRGQVDGDKAIAMLVLLKYGVHVSESTKKSIKTCESGNIKKLSAAVDVFAAYRCFIEEDRHGSFNGTERYAHKFVETMNSFEGRRLLSINILTSSWTFKVEGREYKYIRGKYNEKTAQGLLDFLVDISEDKETLSKVFTEINILNK